MEGAGAQTQTTEGTGKEQGQRQQDDYAGQAGGAVAAQQTIQGRREGQWQHNGPHMAQQTMVGKREGQGMYKGPWRAEGRWQGLDSDNRGKGQKSDHAGQEGGAVAAQWTMEGRSDRIGILTRTMEG